MHIKTGLNIQDFHGKRCHNFELVRYIFLCVFGIAYKIYVIAVCVCFSEHDHHQQ